MINNEHLCGSEKLIPMGGIKIMMNLFYQKIVPTGQNKFMHSFTTKGMFLRDKKKSTINHFYQKMVLTKCSVVDLTGLLPVFNCYWISGYDQLIPQSQEVGRLIGHMIEHPEKFVTLKMKSK